MFHALLSLTAEYDWRLVALASAVCLLASLVAVGLFRHAHAAADRNRSAWLALAGVVAGCGIWASHFIATLAYQPGVTITHGIVGNALAVTAAIVATAVGLWLAAKPAPWAAPLGGAVVGLGIAGMHELGITAVDLPGQVVRNLDLELLSVALAMAFGACALAITARRSGAIATLIAVTLLALAIMSQHFAAMAAIDIVLDASITAPPPSLTPAAFAIAIAAVAGAILGTSLIGAFADSYLSARTIEQNQRFDMAVNNMSQGLCMFDAEYRLVDCNQSYLEIHGLPQDIVASRCTIQDLVRKHFEAGTFNGDVNKYVEAITREVENGESTNKIIETRDGRVISIVNRPLPNGGRITTHEDITERHVLYRSRAAVEAQLREQKVQLDAALNNMSQGVCMFDAKARVVVFNRRFLDMYNLSPQVVRTGCTLQELIRHRKEVGLLDGDPDRYCQEILDGIAAGRTAFLTVRATDGRLIQSCNQPMPGGGWVTVHEDVTARHQAEQQLTEQKLKLDTALNNMNHGLLMFDAEARLVLCNQRYLQMYDLSPDIVKPGCTMCELLALRKAQGTFPRDPDRHVAELRVAAAEGRPTSFIAELSDGRTIAIANIPMSDGRWVSTHEDVTERRRAEQERDRSRAFAATVIESVPVTIVVKNAHDRRYRLINRAGEEYFGVPRESMIGKLAHEIFTKDIADTIEKHDQELLETMQPRFYDEQPVTTPSGDKRIVTVTRMPIRDTEGKPQYLLTVVDDRTHRKRAEAQIAHMARHDALTGIPNRAAFTACIEATIERQEGQSFCLMSIDIDRFKEVNDVFGHVTGDELLRQLSHRLQSVIGGAFLARLGGDEFVVIATDGEQPAAAEALADRILSTLSGEFTIGKEALRTGVSIGIAIFPVDGEDAATLVANADAALYRAKADGRGTYRFFEANMDKRLRDRRVLHQELTSAIERGEFSLHYQPQARIGGEVTGFEALVRWDHPTRGAVPPGTFIPIAEESTLIVPLGEWIMREACRQAASWHKPLQIAINLSPVQFRHGDLAGLVHSVLLETGLAPQRLELEITEGVLIDDFSRAVSILRRLKALGVRIAMDDFGTGYSSLSYLQSFPFDKIKIDQTFISNLERNPQSATIIRAVIGLARGLEVPVIAEGVETKDQLAFLTREACDEVQGYLIGRPLPIGEYAAVTGRSQAVPIEAAS